MKFTALINGARVVVLKVSDRVSTMGPEDPSLQIFAGKEIILSGVLSVGKDGSCVPYPGETKPSIVLDRPQSAHLALEILKNLSPDGEIPDDAAELLDFVSGILQEGRQA